MEKDALSGLNMLSQRCLQDIQVKMLKEMTYDSQQLGRGVKTGRIHSSNNQDSERTENKQNEMNYQADTDDKKG